MLEVSNLEVSYAGGIRALQGVSLKVNKGEIVAVVGSNGAGKTTLLKTISGLVNPTGGESVFEGKRLNDIPGAERVKTGIALVPEGGRIFTRLNVWENLILGSYTNKDLNHRNEMLERVYTLFPILKERAKQRAGTLSGGERQMLAIGRAMMSRPRLLMLDEPSLGLMPILVDQILEVIKGLNEKDGLTILLVEQNVYGALEMAHRGYILQTGRIVQEGTGKELLESDTIKKAYLGM